MNRLLSRQKRLLTTLATPNIKQLSYPFHHQFRNMSSPSTSSQQTAKTALRKSLKSHLSTLTSDSITAQSATAQNLILSHPAYKNASSLSIYLSMPSAEAQTDILVREALRDGKKVFVPFIYTPQSESEGGATEAGGGKRKKKRKVMDLLRLREGEFEGLQRDGWGIPSLSEEGVGERENAMGGQGLSLAREGDEGGKIGGEGEGEDRGGLDLVVVPAVAFDKKLNRLGHGAGFYDTFLTRFCEGGKREKPFLSKFLTFTDFFPLAIFTLMELSCMKL